MCDREVIVAGRDRTETPTPPNSLDGADYGRTESLGAGNTLRSRIASRRTFLSACGAALVGACSRALTESSAAAVTREVPVYYLPATELARMIAERQVSAAEVAEAFLGRIEEVNPKLNAIVQMDVERVRTEAERCDADLRRGISHGPLHGVPFTIKDCFLTKGVVTTNGCSELRNYVPTKDATVVQRLRSAGGVMLGKTNVPEMCYLNITDNLIYGRTNNPYDLAVSPDGSSGGEAAIIAAGGSPFGIGTDIGGSIRNPSHACGIAGIKPTSGRVPETGMLSAFPLSIAQWNGTGPMARSSDDLKLVLRIIAGPDDHDPHAMPIRLDEPSAARFDKLRVAFFTSDGVSVPPREIQDTVRMSADVLRDAGATVSEACPPEIAESADLWLWLNIPLLAASARYWKAEYARMAGAQRSEEQHFAQAWWINYLDTLEQTGEYGPARYVKLEVALEDYRRRMFAFMRDFDLIVCPANGETAGPHLTRETLASIQLVDVWDGHKKGAGAYCYAFNLTGWPATVVRAGTAVNGLPIGVQIIAKPWHEHLALAVSKTIEQVPGCGWQPPTGL